MRGPRRGRLPGAGCPGGLFDRGRGLSAAALNVLKHILDEVEFRFGRKIPFVSRKLMRVNHLKLWPINCAADPPASIGATACMYSRVNTARELEPVLLTEGEVLRDTYVVERFLGEGAFAEVYRVRHRFLGRQAMKVMKTPGVTRAEAEALLSEAAILSSIGHPNIIRVFDAGVADTGIGTCAYFTMEYVPGGSLQYFWRAHGRRFVPVADTVEIIRQVCRGLAVAHTQDPPIVHRDIKPQNLLVGYDAGGLRIRVSDFGLARRVNALTLLASAQGTRAFKAPEFLLDVDSCAGDVWAVGTVLYLLLTDQLPYPKTAEMMVPDASCWATPPAPPSRVNVLVNPALEAIAARALAAKPADRYADAGEMLAALDEYILAVSGPTPTPDLPARDPTDKAALGAAGDASARAGAAPTAGAKPVVDGGAESLLKQAREMAHQPGKLVEAADLLEQALNLKPEWREQYEYQLQLWRRGIML